MVRSYNTSERFDFSEVSIFLQDTRKTNKIMDIYPTKFIVAFPIKKLVLSESD